MRHEIRLWDAGEGESSAETGEIEIDAGRVFLRLGSAEVGSWASERVRIREEGEGQFVLQVGQNQLRLRPRDVASFAMEVKAHSLRSRLSDPPLPTPVAPSAPPAPLQQPAPVQQPAQPVQAMSITVGSAKSPGVAAVLSALWSGLGQIYNGQVGLGIVFMVLQVINAILAFALIGFITGFIVWVWSIANAHSGAQRYNRARGIIS